MKKNLGIVTLQGATNYGAVLQAYALQETLKSNGFNVEIINYYSNHLYGYYKPNIFLCNKNLKTFVGKILRYKINKLQYHIFETFRNNYLNLSKKICNISSLKDYSKKFDYLIVGSDQVWNSNIICGDEDLFYLNISDTAKKYSYAASVGSIKNIKDISSLIDSIINFSNISVRESDLNELLIKQCSINSSLVCDPTLLLSKNEWMKISKPCEVPEEFLLVYMLNENEYMIQSILNFAESSNINVINIGKNISSYSKKINYVSYISPNQFIYLFSKAKYVITNSFHGTAFSIIFKKKFLTFGNGKLNSRMETLLKAFDLKDRMVDANMSSQQQCKLIEKDYDYEDDVDYIVASKKFIKNIK